MSCRRTVPTPPITPKMVRPQHSNVLKSILPPYLGARLLGNQCIWSPKLSIKIIESFTWLKLLRMGLCGSCGQGFKSQAHHQCLFQFIMLMKSKLYLMLEWEKDENKTKRDRDWPLLKTDSQSVKTLPKSWNYENIIYHSSISISLTVLMWGKNGFNVSGWVSNRFRNAITPTDSMAACRCFQDCLSRSFWAGDMTGRFSMI